MSDRWATFDCYGTLVDWENGIGSELGRLFGAEEAPRLLVRYHELERMIQSERPAATYREVLTAGVELLTREEATVLPAEEMDALARSLPDWPVFPDVRRGLEAARRRGWRLAILSNTDRDLIDSTIAAIGVPFELAIVAGEIGSYKPAHRHWEVFRDETGADEARHVHVAQSIYHDIAPATELGLQSIWVDRQGEPPDPRPARTLFDLTGLAAALDELVPA